VSKNYTERATGCCLCWIDGVWSKPIDNWPYTPICREHMAESLARTGGHPVIAPSPGFATANATLQ
jgi:hypothetical protein